MSQLGNSIPGFQLTTSLQRLLEQFQTVVKYKSPSEKYRKRFQKFSNQTGSHPNVNNQLAGVTSLYQLSKLVTRLFKNEVSHTNSSVQTLPHRKRSLEPHVPSPNQFFTQRYIPMRQASTESRMFCSTSLITSSHKQ